MLLSTFHSFWDIWAEFSFSLIHVYQLSRGSMALSWIFKESISVYCANSFLEIDRNGNRLDLGISNSNENCLELLFFLDYYV